jgi:integrase
MRREPTGSVYQRGATWWVRIYHGQALPYRESSRSDDKAVGEKLLAKRLAEMGIGRFRPRAESYSFAKLEKGIRADYKARKLRTLRRLEIELRYLRKFFGRRYASDITRSLVREYQTYRLDQGAANATVNREVMGLKRMLTLAEDAIGPSIRMPSLEEDNVREGFVTAEQFERIRTMLPGWPLDDLTAFAFYSAWRISEVKTLRWKFVDLGSRSLRLSWRKSKNKKGRELPLIGELWNIIDRADKNRAPNCEYVFHRNGKPVKDFRQSWVNARQMAEQNEALVHDLRRSGIKRLRRVADEKTIMSISGHRSRSTFDRYQIVDSTDMGNALERAHQAELRYKDDTMPSAFSATPEIPQ